MSFDVQLPARYVSLDILVTEMANAVARAKRDNGHAGTPDAEVIAGAEIECESRVRQLCDDRQLPGREYDTYAKSDWTFLKYERDLFSINDLNACKALTDEGFAFRQVRDEAEHASLMANLAEIVNNDTLIDWEYWVERMPVLKAPDAARLMRGLDPDLYASLDATPTSNDVSRSVQAVKMIQRLAEAQDRDVDTPEHWLAWAGVNKVAVHQGFEIAVKAKVAAHRPPEFVAEITPFRFEYAGYISHITKEQLEEELAGIAARVASGKPRVADAAIKLAEGRNVSADLMLTRLNEAYHAGHLVVRDCSTEIPLTRETRYRPWMDIVLNADLDTLLREHWRVTYLYSDMVGPGVTNMDVEPGDAEFKQKTLLQEDRIIQWLEAEGHDPRALPKPPKGGKGVKAAARTALTKDKALYGATGGRFDPAWDRLRASGRIADKKN
ncbi:MAG: hypothetical protein V4864_16115 [Pseudomonadota bacterium]